MTRIPDAASARAATKPHKPGLPELEPREPAFRRAGHGERALALLEDHR